MQLHCNMQHADSIQDSLTGDELISDSYDLKEVDGVVYEANCTKITIGGESFGASASTILGEDFADLSRHRRECFCRGGR